MRISTAVAVLVAIVATGTLARSAAPPDSERPAYRPLRFEEDWSSFDPATGDDFFDPIKHVSLSEDGNVWASFGGEVRARVESWQDFAFVNGNDDTFLLGRARLYGDLHVGEFFRVFVEGISAHVTDRDLPGGRRTLDVDVLDVHNAFADLRIPLGAADGAVTLRIGRQELLFGKQRLVSPLPWANAMRSWDAARAIVELEGWRVDAFYSRYIPVQSYEFNDWGPGSNFYGVYGAGGVEILETPLALDLYVLGLDRDDVVFNGSAGDEDRYSLGTRLGGALGESGFDFDVEGTYQLGKVGSADVSAWSLASEVGYRLRETAGTPRLHLGFDYASGDDAPADGKVETFNQLFPLGHAYLGTMDFIGRQNVIDASAGVSVKPTAKLTMKLAGHLFWRASNDDAVYNPGGGVLRAGSLSNRSEVGQEVDLTGTFAVNRHLTLEGGYSHFFPGDVIEDSGPDEDVDWFYLQALYRF